ncbi:hypothetical protein B0H19DRAFT_86746 [Mycena capillaripes]|nr:hypothetical protein B0H19DRAFT_86746 [Mycena capillaripes]
MPEDPVGIREIVQLLSSNPSLNAQDTARTLSKLIGAIDKCPIADFDPTMTIESLLPYLAPLGTRYGDPVPLESAFDKNHTKFAGAAITVLGSILRKYDATPLWPAILLRLITCWPSTCMGMLFYSRALMRTGTPPTMLEVDSPAHAFSAIVTLLQMYTNIESLAALIRNTPEMTALIIRLWVLEVRNSSLSTQLTEMFQNGCQPTAVRLLDIHLFSCRTRDSCGALLISTLEGGLGNTAIAGVGLEHIRRSSSALSDLALLPIAVVQNTNLRNLSGLHSTPLDFLLLSQNSVRVVTEALTALTSRSFDASSADDTADCITQICEYLQNTSQAMDSPI